MTTMQAGRVDKQQARRQRGQVAARARAHDAARSGAVVVRRSVVVPDDDVQRALWLWLRGESYASIGRALGVHRTTAADLVQQAYAEIAPVQERQLAEMKAEAVARLRGLIRQAWVDHDADEERECAILDAVVGGKLDGAVRYQSQRAAYLRVILDAEKEIARIEGLYDDVLSRALAGNDPTLDGVAGMYVLRIERVVPAAGGRVTVEVEEVRGIGSRERDEESDAAASVE